MKRASPGEALDEVALRASLTHQGLSKVQSRKIRNRLSALTSRQRQQSQMDFLTEMSRKLQSNLRFLINHQGYRDVDAEIKQEIEDLCNASLDKHAKPPGKRARQESLPEPNKCSKTVEYIAAARTSTTNPIFEPAEFLI